MKAIYRLSILFAVLLLTSTSVFSQGCMGGDSGGGVKVRGFIQPQWSYDFLGTDDDGNSLDENSFYFNRARLGVLGSIIYDIDYYFFMEMSPFKTPAATPYLLDAYVSYTRFAPYAKISLGQFKSPFSLEQNTGCSELFTVNRSDVVTQLAGPMRDMGVMVSGGNDTTLIRYSVGYMNGTGLGVYDDNGNKHMVGRLTIKPLEFMHFGGSFRTGKVNPTNPDSVKNDLYRYAAEMKIDYKNFMIQGEYMMGLDRLYSASMVPIYGGCGGIVGYDTKTAGDYHKSGYYVMASDKTNWNLEPVIKFDSYTADADTTNAWSDRFTVGFNYFINDYSRLQVNYVYVNEPTAITNDMFIIQLQAKF
ncbi:MAG: hypothetical protein C0592_04380 [Marinilabiliales bacterium]|nr:MAG: hypothetical protein C0592_04380 [Marinilabiliales bacterium]